MWGCGVARRKPWEVDDELWAVIEPLLPRVERRVRHPGRKRPDRLVFQGILFVLHTGIAWEHFPQENRLRFGHDLLASSGGVDRGRRLAAAAREPPRPAARRGCPYLLAGRVRRLSHTRVKGGSKTGRSPVDRGRNGSKHHLITDATGIPLATTLTGGNRNDVTQFIPLLQAVPIGPGQARPPPPTTRNCAR